MGMNSELSLNLHNASLQSFVGLVKDEYGEQWPGVCLWKRYLHRSYKSKVEILNCRDEANYFDLKSLISLGIYLCMPFSERSSLLSFEY